MLRVSKPVISVGNLTVGGTGKTPVTLALARLLTEQGKKVGIVSRNYKAASSGISQVDPKRVDAATWYGDEPFLLARELPGVAVFVGPQKSQTAEWALLQRPDLDLLIIDDGFQHRRLARDLDLVLVDATDAGTFDPWPVGRGRENERGLVRANLILVTKTNWVPRAEVDRIRERLPKSVPVIEVEFETIWPELRAETKFGAFAGIARPEVFFELVKKKYVGQMMATWAFADHQNYGSVELAPLRDFLAQDPDRLLLTTEKDAIKILEIELRDRLRVVGLEAHFRQKESLLEKLHAVVG